MYDKYTEIAHRPDAKEYGEVFWKQWYAALYVYTKICSQTADGRDSVFTSLGTDNVSSLVGAINQCDRRGLPGYLLALKQAIDNDWEKIKQMDGEKFLNYAGCYKQNNKTSEK